MHNDHQALLDRLRDRHQVPGASLGVLSLADAESSDRIDSYASGVLNVETGVPVRTDAVFQIGSISKTFTATMIMQLAEQSRLEPDQTVQSLLPWFRLPDPEAAATVTIRQLLSHSSGIDGDVFTDYGRGDDAVTRYVAGLADVGQLYRPGSMFSYCNAGFVVLGRVIEELTGTTWDTALHDQLLGPLGLTSAGTLPEQAILGNAAVGHSGGPGEPRQLIRRWQLPRSIGPAGLIHADITDLLRYARLHLRDGSVDGVELITGGSVAAMRSRQIGTPPGIQVDGWQGLGWQVDHFDGHQVFGHNGATVGQYAYLLLVPDAGLAVGLLTNGPGAGLLWAELRQALLAEHGIAAPFTVDAPPEQPHRLTGSVPAVGRFARTGEEYEVAATDSGLQVTVIPTDESPDPDDEPETMPLVPVDDHHFVGRTDDRLGWTTFSYGTFTDDQNPAGGDYLYTGTRLTPRARAD
ncbi:serine hydrolase domain-containing protein [Microlunatus soli]|uniref:CubicO group peptidase, beta-lactamase class C family n=1 Tax=Microlunatus soli TaxID=630515 RepID=A0A1H1U6D2_9ACTN|nr:serine hydrolase domain-containing protein [Microlunatus soli]SDS68135.1 CubicO group peptidase, beta-lactamase class C family [Microlunatus soli]